MVEDVVLATQTKVTKHEDAKPAKRLSQKG